jgi:hypothetical protein
MGWSAGISVARRHDRGSGDGGEGCALQNATVILLSVSNGAVDEAVVPMLTA